MSHETFAMTNLSNVFEINAESKKSEVVTQQKTLSVFYPPDYKCECDQ